MKNTLFRVLFAASGLLASGAAFAQKTSSTPMNNPTASLPHTVVEVPEGKAIATFGSGCFWCTEAIFQRLAGVEKVESGYSGGFIKNPSYKEVCTGRTGHAEVVQLTYDPRQVSFAELLQAFWQTHDPTTLNRQGNDSGPQYRSAVFYHNQEQRQQAEDWKKRLDAAQLWKDPIVTEITPFTNFYKAEEYHQNYFNENGQQPYCQFVVRPKVEKFEKVFKAKLKHKADQ